MRRAPALLSFALLVGCSPAAERDAGTDVGPDASDAPDATDAPDAPPPLEYTLEHGPAWDEPCPPWDIEPYTLDRALPADPSVRQLWRARVGPRVLGTVLTGPSTAETYLLAAPDAEWQRLADDGPTRALTGVLDPAGGVWTYSRARTLTRYLDDRLLHVRSRGDCERREAWYEDGSLLCFHSGSAHGAIRVSAETGENLWQIFPTTPGGLAADAAEIAVDRTGRLCVSTFAGLFAFQTDALPAEGGDGCAMRYQGCNERRDGAAVRWDR